MRSPSLALLIILTLAVVNSCTRVSQTPVSIQEDPDQFIRLEGRYGDERRQLTTRFDHPLMLSSEDWERILAGIQVQSRKDSFIFTREKNPQEPAFSATQIAFLAPGLSRAFSRAHPDEFVVFGLSQNRSRQLTEVTTGGWFVEGASLHLILANYRHAVTTSQVRDQLWRDPLSSNTSPSFALVPEAHQKLSQSKPILSPHAQELLIAYKEFLDATPAVTAPVAPVMEIRPDASLEDRLRKLKSLREKGLITEEEYRSKKKSLLEAF